MAKAISMTKAIEDRRQKMREAGRTPADELIRQARRVAAGERAVRALKARTKEAQGKLAIERRFLRALKGMADERNPATPPMRIFGERAGE